MKKKTVKVFIEKSDYGYSAYMDDTPLSYSCLGEGKTVAETIEDFKDAYAEMREYYESIGKFFEEVDLEFYYDPVSFIQSLCGVFTLSGLSKITGINEKQLGHYVQGVNKPRPATAQKIKESIIKYAKELSTARLV